MSGGDDMASMIALAAAAGGATGSTEAAPPVPPPAAEAGAAGGAAEVAGEGEASQEAFRTQAMQVRYTFLTYMYTYGNSCCLFVIYGED